MVDPAWILAAMTALEPESPYRETFARTAHAIAAESSRSPLPGQTEDRTAAIVLGVAWFESRFQVDAMGDCEKSTAFGTCAPGAKRPRSLGLMQIGVDNLRAYQVASEDAVSDPAVNVRVGLSMARQSFKICAARPLPDRLAWYAKGGNGCPRDTDGVLKSQHRVNKAIWIYAHFGPATPIASGATSTVPVDQTLAGLGPVLETRKVTDTPAFSRE